MDLAAFIASGGHRELYWVLYRIAQGITFRAPTAAFAGQVRRLYEITGTLAPSGEHVSIGALDTVFIEGIAAWLGTVSYALGDPRLYSLGCIISSSIIHPSTNHLVSSCPL